jgi:cytochrome P450
MDSSETESPMSSTSFDPPVAWDALLAGWTVKSYDLVRQALRDPERFTSEGGAIAENLAGQAMLVTDSPVHDAVRGLWAKSFSGRTAAARRQELEELADSLLEPALSQLKRGAVVDLVPLFKEFAGKVVLDLLNFSRVSEGDFRRWYELVLDSAAFSISPNHPLYTERCKAKAEIYEVLKAEVSDRRERLARGEKPTDLVSMIVSAEDCEGITGTVILDNLFNLFTGGADTTVRWMGNSVVVLYADRSSLEEIRANPMLLPQALEEVMRLKSVTRFAVRIVRTDGVELAGQPLSRGDTVYLLTSIANHDPTIFSDPERFDIHRKGKSHLGFGYGLHQCIGMNLARAEAQALIGRLITAAPELEVAEVQYGDDTVVRGPQYLGVRPLQRGC